MTPTSPAATAAVDAGPLVTAFSNAPREELTLLTASGDTCGAATGSPTPFVVEPSSDGNEGGGGGP